MSTAGGRDLLQSERGSGLMLVLVAGGICIFILLSFFKMASDAFGNVGRLESQLSYEAFQQRVLSLISKSGYCKSSLKILGPVPAAFDSKTRLKVALDLFEDGNFFSEGLIPSRYPRVQITSLALRDIQETPSGGGDGGGGGSGGTHQECSHDDTVLGSFPGSGNCRTVPDPAPPQPSGTRLLTANFSIQGLYGGFLAKEVVLKRRNPFMPGEEAPFNFTLAVDANGNAQVVNCGN